jgi:hypothetical protein
MAPSRRKISSSRSLSDSYVANDLSKAFDRLNAAVTDSPKAVLQEVGEFAISLITLRTRKGLDADRKRFKPYSARYVPVRQHRGLQTDSVDLTVSGHMLGSMVPAVTGDNEVTIEFSGTKEIAKALGNSQTRDFFDVRADEELEAIADLFGDMIVAEVLK